MGAGKIGPTAGWRNITTIFYLSSALVSAARDHILAGILPGVESACDLACGTGTTAVLQERRVYGVDLSPIMCRVARAKARRRHAPVRVMRGDMRNFRLPERVDLVRCEFDATLPQKRILPG